MDFRSELADEAEPPEQIGYLCDWFDALSDWRDSSMGVGPLSHQEIECWSRLYKLDPPISTFEVDVLRKIDRECRSYHAEKRDESVAQRDSAQNRTNRSATPIADALREVKAAREAQKKGGK